MNYLDMDLNSFVKRAMHGLGENDSAFLERVYRDGLKKYDNRICAIDFIGHDNILDAGCGFGQWSLTLAAHNNQVSSCDISETRVHFLNRLASELGISNIKTDVCKLEYLPYEDQSFDAIFCYGVIFLTPWRKTLQSFRRVLRPDGKLYVNANALGWYVFLWCEEHNKMKDYDPKLQAARAMSDTLLYDRKGIYEDGMEFIIDSDEMIAELEMLGFEKIQMASEGMLHINPRAHRPQPFFSAKYYGQPGVYEAIATLTQKGINSQ